MNAEPRPRRSVLYMPGSNQRALEKARTLPADTLVLDLEDAVGPARKAEAREQVLQAVAAGGYGQRELVVRVNRLDTPWGRDDVMALREANCDAICLPKVENSGEIEQLASLLASSSAPPKAIWGMIETPAGVLHCEAIAAHPRLSVLAMGTTDLAKELRVPHTPDRLGLQTALSHCVLAARAGQCEILDGVYLDLENDQGLLQACQQGRQLGFDGKTLIHPRQLAAANEVFAPGAEEQRRAQLIIDAWQQAEAEGLGVVVVEGKLVEGMHVDEARRCLQIAEMIQQLQQA